MTNGASRGSIVRRIVAYTQERFPLAAYVPMILVAAFATLGYSRVARGAPGFAPTHAYLATVLTLVAAFFTLRVADEHKDAEVDRLSRPELPVPRGLVSLRELRTMAAILVAVAMGTNAWLAPVLLLPLAAVATWMALMTREFFVRAWLRERPAIYLLSHMVIMPLLMWYATSVDWLATGQAMPGEIVPFLVASYATGMVLEIGRKVRSPVDERAGVETYSATWGTLQATLLWLTAFALSAGFVAASGLAAGSPWPLAGALLFAPYVIWVAWRFVRAPHHAGGGRALEKASATWTMTAYMLLGAPYLERAVS